jgi:hypothetical protein
MSSVVLRRPHGGHAGARPGSNKGDARGAAAARLAGALTKTDAPIDVPLAAAARALSAGDPLGALRRVALRDDASALALRGIAMAQLGEFGRADDLLGRAARAFGRGEPVARARCVVARAEVALAARAFGPASADRALPAAVRALDAYGDRANALHGRLVVVRRLLLVGDVDGAGRALAGLSLDGAPAMLAAVGELLAADVALRRLQTRDARAALDRARLAGARAQIPALSSEIERALGALREPAARLLSPGGGRAVLLEEVESVLASGDLVVDACRRVARAPGRVVALARRPVLFALLRALAEAWPGEAPRDGLISRAFGARRADASHRARLRVEIGRLRRQLRGLAELRATALGFALAPAAGAVAVLAPPVDDEDASLLALLADGQAWSTSALALALGASQRTAQRRLAALEAASKVRSLGRGRARRWLAPPAVGFTTTLLLPAAPPLG